MVWRLVSRKVGQEVFLNISRVAVSEKRSERTGSRLQGAALVERGGEPLKTLLEQQLDQVTDMDLMVGSPQARGSEWVSALRNLGSTDAAVTVAAITERGERVTVEGVVPGRNFADVVFRTPARIVRVEIDPEKFILNWISVTTLCQRSGTRQKRLATRHCNLVLRISSRLKQFRAK